MKVRVHEWERVWNKDHTKYKDVFDDAGVWYLNISYLDPKCNLVELRKSPSKCSLNTKVYLRKISKIFIGDVCVSFEGWHKPYKKEPAVFCRFKCYYDDGEIYKNEFGEVIKDERLGEEE